jgi:dipeptide/tripeptide permease
MILILEIPATMALRRLPALGIIGAGYALVGLGFGLFGLGTASWLAVAAMVVLTVGEILYKTTATAHVLDAAPPHLVGQYQGLYTGAATSGSMLAPPVGAFVYSVAPAALWPLCAVAAIGAGLLAWRSGRVATPRHEQALAAASDPAPKTAA